MNEKALRILEYDKIIQALTDKAGSAPGKNKCKQLLPSDNLGDIQFKQTQTRHGLDRLFKKGNISFSGVKDMRPSFMRLDLGGILSLTELLSIASLLENTARIKAYGRPESPDSPADSLTALFDGLAPMTPLSAEIRRCILSEDEISDEASPVLKQIRRSMSGINTKVHTQLNSIINSSARNYLQDTVVTMRNGRYCIPVKAEYKSQVPGMIHDQSSSGSTLFIEPSSIVRLNNEMRELELKEHAEIEKILAELSSRAAENLEALTYDLDIMTELDFIFAKASLAMEQNATEPIFNTDGIVRIRQGRHPLIPQKQVVPIDIRLGTDFHLLVITGPNTGGKTVSLKTMGLLTLMGQAGLHIPALSQSQLSVFTEVYADIGDEQSIEQSLSTFSSHMTNVVSFLEKADRDSLVLFDELGAGTDPTEGAALAISILSYLHQRGIRTMATTHYSELKVYALSTEGVENASCEFDVETLRPTYRLLIGIPGKSNAFAISSKLGLPDHIIEDARTRIRQEDESFENLISSLEQSRREVEREQSQIRANKLEMEELKKQLEAKQEKFSGRQEKILSEAKEEAHRILREAKEYADKTIRQFQKYEKESPSIRKMEADREKLRQKLKTTQKQGFAKAVPQSSTLKASDLHIGDSVKILSLNVHGTVSTLPDAKGNLYVTAGIIRTKTKISDLVLADAVNMKAPTPTPRGKGKVNMSKSASISAEINLLGRTVDEALALLDKYLDDAYMSHIPSVRIVHGKGTGKLRDGIHNYLRRQKHVASFRLGVFGEGDSGVTIVEFK